MDRGPSRLAWQRLSRSAPRRTYPKDAVQSFAEFSEGFTPLFHEIKTRSSRSFAAIDRVVNQFHRLDAA